MKILHNATIALMGLALTFSSASFADADTLTKNLKNNYPNLSAKVVGKSPVDDIYEVQVAGNLVYTDEDARYFFVGNLVDFKTKTNLTEQRQQELNQINISQLPLENAVKNVKGKGERKLYVFSDPDCPYCQRLEQELTTVDNVTIYTFLMPLKALHPNAEMIAKKVWCSKNRYEAWEDYMLHKQAPSAVDNCKNPIAQNIDLAATLNITGTPTLFLNNGQRISGGRTAQELEMLLETVK